MARTRASVEEKSWGMVGSEGNGRERGSEAGSWVSVLNKWVGGGSVYRDTERKEGDRCGKGTTMVLAESALSLTCRMLEGST